MSVGFQVNKCGQERVPISKLETLYYSRVCVLVGCDDKAKTEEVPTRPVRTLAVDNPVGGVLIKHTGEIRPMRNLSSRFALTAGSSAGRSMWGQIKGGANDRDVGAQK